MKKPKVIFTTADKTNEEWLKRFTNSLRKFHSEEELPLVAIKGDELKARLDKDQQFFYRQKPVLAEELIKEYDLVIGADCDQIVTGDLSYIWKTTDYDVATVLNWNRTDPKTYGVIQGWGILPIEYFNAGLVAMRSEKFIHHWNVVCHSAQFDRMQYREQDLLNILAYYGNYNVRCLDHGDGPAKMNAWWGLIAKGEWLKAKLQDGKIIIPQAKDNFPKMDVELKLVHIAGGTVKQSYRTLFTEEVIKHLDYLISDRPQDKNGDKGGKKL